MMSRLFKHKSCTSIAAEVVKYIRLKDKDYVKIKVTWWKLTHNKPMYSLGVTEWLQDASIEGSRREKRKYPLSKWLTEWEPL